MNPQTVVAPKSRGLPKWFKVTLIVLGALIVVFVGIFLLTNQATKNAVKVSDKFVAAIQANDPSAAYAVGSADFKQATSEAQLTQTFSEVSPALQGKTKATGRAINKTSGHPATAVIVYTVATSDGTKYIRVVLQDNNPWQVVNFRSSTTPLDTNSTD